MCYCLCLVGEISQWGLHGETTPLNTKRIHTLNHWIDPVNTNMLAFPTSQPNLLNLFLFNFITSLSGWGRGGVEQRML